MGGPRDSPSAITADLGPQPVLPTLTSPAPPGMRPRGSVRPGRRPCCWTRMMTCGWTCGTCTSQMCPSTGTWWAPGVWALPHAVPTPSPRFVDRVRGLPLWVSAPPRATPLRWPPRCVPIVGSHVACVSWLPSPARAMPPQLCHQTTVLAPVPTLPPARSHRQEGHGAPEDIL